MDVFQYLDPYAFMQSYYQVRKTHEDSFSYAVWADEIGVKSSSTLRMMVNRKKKLSAGVAERFLERSLPNQEAKNYFRLLVSYAHASTNQQRTALWSALSNLLTNQIEQKEVKNFLLYLSDPIIPKILTILSFVDEVWFVEKIAKALNAKPESIQTSLDQLKLAEMVVNHISDAGLVCWKATDRLLKVSDKLGDAAVANYHNASLNEAIEAQSLPKNLRRYNSLLLPLSEEELQNLKQEVEVFTKQLIARYQSDHYRDRRLFKLNLNFFPVSEDLTAESSEV